MIKVGVVFGGVSVEHEVSIISAVQAMYKIDTSKYEVIPIYITKKVFDSLNVSVVKSDSGDIMWEQVKELKYGRQVYRSGWWWRF